jgi:hypothetical protein
MHSSTPKSSEAGTYELHVVLTGNGAAAPTKTRGNGLVVTREDVGVYRLTLNEDLGPFMSLGGHCFGVVGAGAVEDVAGYTLVHGAWNSAGRYLDIAVFDSTFAPVDLAATETLDLTLIHKMSTAV